MSAHPVARFHELLAEAAAGALSDPTAMALATADAGGRPSVRMVLLKAADERGFVFYTNLGSRKGRELATNPKAALCFHWPHTGWQVRVEGVVEPVGATEADAYHASRPRGSQIGAWASRQSEPVASREALLEQYREVERRYEGQPVPRPPYWSGFRLVPERIEMWRTDEFRLHHRTLHTRQADGSWTAELLQP